MTKFGELLRGYREKCRDPYYPRRRLSQVRLGELIGIELEDHGFSGAAVSGWESGNSTIPVDNRNVLVALLKVLHKHGGLGLPIEADGLLAAGNYRSLDTAEIQHIFPHGNLNSEPNLVSYSLQEHHRVIPPSVENSLLKSWEGFQSLLAEAREGPQPAWPRILVALTRRVLKNWTLAHTLRIIGWLWLWLVTWLLIMPSLRWPFANQQAALGAIIFYMAGTMILPPFIGIQTEPKKNEFWQQQNLAENKTLYLYIYQGAGIGFHLGYFAIFLGTLLGYYLHIRPTTAVEAALTLFPMIMSYVGAQLVPYNLWRVYERLKLADGAIFFVFLILGPMWGYFFLNFYTWLLTPVSGVTILLLVATSLVAVMNWHQQRMSSMVIPAHWWSLLYGLILVAYEISSGRGLYEVIALTCLIIFLSALLGFGRIRFTLAGMTGGLASIGLLLIALNINVWSGRILAVVLLLAWWCRGKRFLAFPPSFWIVILVEAGNTWALKNEPWSVGPASVVVGIITVFALLWEYYRKQRFKGSLQQSDNN